MKIVTVIGARPQFVKAAAVSFAIEEGGTGIEEVLVHTGQHYDPLMSDVFFDELDVRRPGHFLGVGSARHGQQTADVMARFEPILCTEQPDAVVVYGDTNSTLGAALVAAKLHVPVVHVEAGLRSFDRRMPEEINRVLTDHVSDLLLCPSPAAIDNLRREAITEGVVFTGDVMRVVLDRTLRSIGETNPVAERLGLTGDYVVATMHRAGNTDDPIVASAIVDALVLIAEERPVVFPVHPRTRGIIATRSHLPRSLHAIDSLGYRDMVALTSGAAAVVTDSGGLQKEAAWLGVPCITIRDETEWIETVETGWNVVVGSDTGTIVDAVRNASAPSAEFDAYGGLDGARAVVNALRDRYEVQASC